MDRDGHDDGGGPVMPNRCASCGGIAGRTRSIQVPGPWLSYLRSERGMAPPVGTLTMPLCPECYPDVAGLEDDSADRSAWESFLDGIDLDALIDEGA